MTLRKTAAERRAEAAAEQAADDARADEAAEAIDTLPEDAEEVTYTYAERYNMVLDYLTEFSGGQQEIVNDELLAVMPRGEFTAFVYRRHVTAIEIPAFDEETEAMPVTRDLEPVILQTSAKFRTTDDKWSHGSGPKTSLLVYGD